MRALHLLIPLLAATSLRPAADRRKRLKAKGIASTVIAALASREH
jgi:hypothetical protein